MRMRSCVWAVAMLCIATAAPPLKAEELVFSPQAFQVFGGIGDAGSPSGFLLKRKNLGALAHTTVAFEGDYSQGSIIVRTAERKLYYVLGNGQAIQYYVGVGREGFEWSGTAHVSRKAEWPDWRPPKEMIDREADRGHEIPAYMPGGPDNPLGARAIYIGDTQYRIHGTTQPWSIGEAMSSGCIRMMNEEVIDLYNRVQLGALVVVE
jgi:lipoprotein-anchoring transpeptidase ErfK/SrfK